jgi:hypothetical protein
MSDRAAAVPFKFYDLTLMVDGLISTSARLTRIEPSADRRGSNRFISGDEPPVNRARAIRKAGRVPSELPTDLRERFTPFASRIIVSGCEILKCSGSEGTVVSLPGQRYLP